MGNTIDDLSAAYSSSADDDRASAISIDKDRSTNSKYKEKDSHLLLSIFKKPTSSSSTNTRRPSFNRDASQKHLSPSHSSDEWVSHLQKLREQHGALSELFSVMSSGYVLSRSPPQRINDENGTPSQIVRVPHLWQSMNTLQRSSMSTITDSASIWFDAEEFGAEEYVVRDDQGDEDSSIVRNSPKTQGDSNLSRDEESEASEAEVDDDPLTVDDTPEEKLDSPVNRRTRLPERPNGDEGSLFAVLKKNVGQDLSNIAFPVTFNEPLTLLQRSAEEMEYHDLLDKAAATSDWVERTCYIAAFAVSGYACTKFRSGRKGFTPLLGETFEDTRMNFIAEKVIHKPLVIAYHANGPGWELNATSSGKTKFWGKSFEIIPTGICQVRMGNNTFEWNKPSSFTRNLMMGTKYLEHCGEMMIRNVSTGAQCVLDFKETGYWASTPNVVSGTVYSPDGSTVGRLEGKWDEQLSQKLDSNHFRVMWRIAPFPRDASGYYGYTYFGITLNEITPDIKDKLPCTDSRFRPDVRALEEGNNALAEEEKVRVEQMQRERRQAGQEAKPRWFREKGWLLRHNHEIPFNLFSPLNMKPPVLLAVATCFVYVANALAQTAANISPEWTAAIAKAGAVVANLSLADKVNLGTGVGYAKGAIYISIFRRRMPDLYKDHSPLGVRDADLVSAFPPFNRNLMYQRGAAIGEEHRGKGVNVALGPMMNMMRAPAAGRNWEGFGGDPFLSGEAAYQTIKGTQSVGAQACAKHFVNYEQEHSRDSYSSIVDDSVTERNMKFMQYRYSESYICQTLIAILFEYSNIRQVNGTYACENDKMLNGVLKGELGFPGYVMSDCYFGLALIAAVDLGQVSQERIDDLATRILAAWYMLGQDSGYPAVNFNAYLGILGSHVDVQGDHASLIRQIGAASTVLLKNTGNILPLKAPKTIAIIGNGAGPSSLGTPNGYVDRGGDDGVLAMGWGSGTSFKKNAQEEKPIDAITNRSKVDGTKVFSSLSDTDLNLATSVVSGKEIALVFITADSGEGYLTVEGNAGDRNDLFAWHTGDALVQAVASANNNTIVIVNTVGPIIMEKWINNVNVTAVVWAGLPGQEAGHSLTDILYGTVNPSGRLPYTIAKSRDDYSAQVIYNSTTNLQIPYTEGIFIDYRHFDEAGIEPRFEFGYGISYTTFTYSGLSINGSTSGGTRQGNGPGQSLDPWLHEKVVTVSFTITNNDFPDLFLVNGKINAQIPQLYTTPPTSANTAPMNLKGFDNVVLVAGETKTVAMQLSRFDLSIWDTVAQRYELHMGETGISIGASSRDIRLTGFITVTY
ncbi:hypothetical protein EW145_g2510 [Phellinidium pouzarii]|uniref:beta-glucosidase n=1 Tax=Phellinidium pouzarii TaxID=167371 RepID=A0A4S4LG15_9AGAM|nr:hypothetical protein EW145_g2510 [Phellinidium pouzarii]